jgi:hypothetical protein
MFVTDALVRDTFVMITDGASVTNHGNKGLKFFFCLTSVPN